MKGADKAVLQLTKLTEGRYVFKLTVTDDKGLKGSDTVSINVTKSKSFAPLVSLLQNYFTSWKFDYVFHRDIFSWHMVSRKVAVGMFSSSIP